MEILRDPVSSASHFSMAIVAVLIALFLMRLTRNDPTRRISVMIFAIGSVAVYTASGLYHALRLSPDELRFFQLLDMSTIYLMIAGSATPLAIIILRGRQRAILLYGQWGFALVGIASLWALPKPDHALLVACYLGMGWFICAFIGQYCRAVGWGALRWVTPMMVAYALGAVIEVFNWPVIWTGVIQSHELLHFCDMVGTVCYVVFLVKYVIPYQGPAPVAEVEAEPAGYTATAQA